ncbi:MAG: 23S rRNA (adenine(2503)-C(2))-methyltransferase RlmN, partial [Tistlia sp.]
MSAHAHAFAPPAAGPDGLTDLVGLSLAELTEAVLALGEPRFRATQLWHWIYH